MSPCKDNLSLAAELLREKVLLNGLPGAQSIPSADAGSVRGMLTDIGLGSWHARAMSIGGWPVKAGFDTPETVRGSIS